MSKLTILVVDDDPELRHGVVCRLKRAGHATVIARSGEEALREVAIRRPDAIVLDIRMPDIDGITVLSQLQQASETSTIPVVVLSASTMDEQRAFDAGAKFFLKKPYCGADLIAAVDNLDRSSIASPCCTS